MINYSEPSHWLMQVLWCCLGNKRQPPEELCPWTQPLQEDPVTEKRKNKTGWRYAVKLVSRLDLFVHFLNSSSSKPYRAVFNWVSKVISRLLWFCITTLCDWLTKLAPLSQPMGIQTKTNRVLAARVFPRLAPVTCICFEFWLARCVVYICCDWPE